MMLPFIYLAANQFLNHCENVANTTIMPSSLPSCHLTLLCVILPATAWMLPMGLTEIMELIFKIMWRTRMNGKQTTRTTTAIISIDVLGTPVLK